MILSGVADLVDGAADLAMADGTHIMLAIGILIVTIMLVVTVWDMVDLVVVIWLVLKHAEFIIKIQALPKTVHQV